MIIDDDAETHQKQLSPVEGIKLGQPQSIPCIPTAMDKVVMVDSQTSLSSGDLQSALVKISLQHSDMTLKIPAEDSKDDLATGSSFEDMSTLQKERIPVRDPDERVSGISSSSRDLPSATPFEPTPDILLSEAIVIATFQDKAECRPEVEHITSCQVQASGDPSEMLSRTPPASSEESENLLNQRPTKSNSNAISSGRLRSQQEERPCVRTPRKSVVPKQSPNSHTPNFRRPLLSKLMTNWFYASTRGDLDGKQLIIGEMANSMDVPSSLTGALSLGLNPKSDWMMRVYAFNFLRQHLQERGPKGIQEVAQNFEKVMRLVSQYLDDPHHKVAHAAL